MSEGKIYRIGELAGEFDLPVETIRYYEREGLLAATTRSAGNYRLYDEAQRERLSFIRSCRSLDLTLDEVRALLRVKDMPEERCDQVNALIDSHIGQVTERMDELRRLKQQLQHLREQCGADRRGRDCAILRNLSNRELLATQATRGGRRKTHSRSSR
jgi:Cd(II)/Pb(II)-responsive transcriptional regulator